jgi:hypothetical protein
MAILVFDSAPLSPFARANLRAGGRFPFGPGEFIPWAREQGLLDRSR